MQTTTYADKHSLYWAIELMDPFQLYWTSSEWGTKEYLDPTHNTLHHVRLHNVLSAL